MARLSHSRRFYRHGSAALRQFHSLRSRTQLIKMLLRVWKPDKFLGKHSIDQNALQNIRNCSVNYCYDQATRNGKLDLCGTPVSVFTLRPKFPPLWLIHTNILHMYFHDFRNGITVCSSKGLSFSVWLQNLKQVDPIDLKVLKGSKQTANHVPFLYRQMMKGILSAVSYIHKCGYAVQNLRKKNLCVSDDMIKLCGFEVEHISDELRRHNLVSLHSILSQIIQKVTPACPEDLKDLLSILISPSTTNLEDNILSHLALQSPSMRLSLAAQIFELKGQSDIHTERWDVAAVRFFKELKTNDWREKFKDKLVGCVGRCFDYRRKKDPYRTCVGGSATETLVIEHFFKLIRNLAYHVGEKKGERRWTYQ